MTVVLAYPWRAHKAGETLDLAEGTARDLLAAGLARIDDKTPDKKATTAGKQD